jgi:hypothetical protein
VCNSTIVPFALTQTPQAKEVGVLIEDIHLVASFEGLLDEELRGQL